MKNRRYTPRHAAGSHADFVRIILLITGAVLCAFTVGNLLVGNQNLGVWLPAAAGAPLLLIGIFKKACGRWFQTRTGAVVRRIIIVVYVLALLCFLTACALMINAAAAPPADHADAIIVLGAGVHGEEVTDTLAKRLDKAVAYFQGNPDALLVVTGGRGSNEDITEAEAMRRYLLAQGIPEASVLMEEEATNTRGNFENAKKLLDARLGNDYTTVYVTNDFHIYRAGKEAARAGFADAHGLAAPTPVLTVPGAYMRESAAILFGMLRGNSAA